MLIDAESIYSRQLFDALTETLLSARDRYRIILVSEARLQEDIQSQLKSEATTVDAYMSLLPTPFPGGGLPGATASGRRCIFWEPCRGSGRSSFSVPTATAALSFPKTGGPKERRFRPAS